MSHKLLKKRTNQHFLLDDGTGTCRIDPLYMDVITSLSHKKIFDNYLNVEQGLISVRWMGLGEKIHVYGTFNTLHVDYNKQKDDLIRSRINILKSDQELISQFDANNDGIIDFREDAYFLGVFTQNI